MVRYRRPARFQWIRLPLERSNCRYLERIPILVAILHCCHYYRDLCP